MSYCFSNNRGRGQTGHNSKSVGLLFFEGFLSLKQHFTHFFQFGHFSGIAGPFLVPSPLRHQNFQQKKYYSNIVISYIILKIIKCRLIICPPKCPISSCICNIYVLSKASVVQLSSNFTNFFLWKLAYYAMLMNIFS